MTALRSPLRRWWIIGNEVVVVSVDRKAYGYCEIGDVDGCDRDVRRKLLAMALRDARRAYALFVRAHSPTLH